LTEIRTVKLNGRAQTRVPFRLGLGKREKLSRYVTCHANHVLIRMSQLITYKMHLSKLLLYLVDLQPVDYAPTTRGA
jgi:hypothetical protein